MSTMRLAGKTALVTGGGTGIGAGIALALAREGCRVAISGRRDEKLRDVAARANVNGSESILVRAADVADRAAADGLVEWATAQLGRVDVLINSAGINIANRTVEALDPADWDKLLQVNATGAYNCIRAVLPQMRERKDGLIINVSSWFGRYWNTLGGPGYNATKHAVVSLTETLNVEEAKHGIRATCILPGEVATPILEKRPIPPSAQVRAQMLQAEDLGKTILFVATLPPRACVNEVVISPTWNRLIQGGLEK